MASRDPSDLKWTGLLCLGLTRLSHPGSVRKSMIQQKKKAWGGRFDQHENELMERFNASLPFDKKLYHEDIQGSVAHARMLKKIGVLSSSEQSQIEKGLLAILKDIEAGRFEWDVSQEDIHMAIESKLTEKIGTAGAKLHSGRSRNDQVATDIKLYCRNHAGYLISKIMALQKELVAFAETKGFVPMPGYTHLQRAQPIYLAHHLLAYFEMLERDKRRFLDAQKRLNTSPLGAGALAGSTLSLDRAFTAKELGFDDVAHNSLDAVSDRDHIAEILFCVSLLMVHLSRLSEEWVLWMSQEFSFMTLPQEFCTGSSMMPQKVNPDAPELIRGKCGRTVGNLVALLTTLKGLPLSYNKDLQEDKEPLFDSIETAEICLDVLIRMVPGITIHADAMKAATEKGFLLATDVAEYLVEKGLEFRKAHEVVGTLVRYCIKNKKTLETLTLPEFKKVSPIFEESVFAVLDLETSINKRKSIGGTAKACVKKELVRAKKLLA